MAFSAVDKRKPIWRHAEFQAAMVNAALIVFVPAGFAAYGDYTWDAARPSPPTIFSASLRALPLAVFCIPVGLWVAWRTHFHAQAYRRRPSTLWRGPLESAATGGVLALAVLFPATLPTWAREPFYLVMAYIAFYVVATAAVGLALGLALAATALAVLHVRDVWKLVEGS
jgi:hypothetical protein